VRYFKFLLAMVLCSFGLQVLAAPASLRTETRTATVQTIAGMSQADSKSMIQTAEQSRLSVRDVVAAAGIGQDRVEQYRSTGCSSGCSSGCSTGCSSGCSYGCSSGCSVGCR
jgi:hypothetical protein